MHKTYQHNKNYMFSPLALYFRVTEFPTERKGKKTMIGQNGWLEITERSNSDDNEQTPQKKMGIFNGIRKIVKDIVS